MEYSKMGLNQGISDLRHQTSNLSQGKFQCFEKKYIFPSSLINPICKIAEEWHSNNRW
jgi:hypothetical protein